MKKILIVFLFSFSSLYGSLLHHSADSPVIAALGNTSEAFAQGADAVFFNPANFPLSKYQEVRFSYGVPYNMLNLRDNILAFYFGYSRAGYVGIGWEQLALTGVDENYSTDLFRQYSENFLNISYSMQYKFLSFGIKIKMLFADTSERGAGWGLDVGAAYIIDQVFNVSILMKDITKTEILWTTDYSEKTDLSLDAGMGYQIIPGLKLGIDVKNILSNVEYSSGLEVWFFKSLSLRAGVSYSDNILTPGAGLGVCINHIFLDYSCTLYQNIELTQILGLNYKF